MFNRLIIDPTSKRAAFSSAAVLAFSGLVLSMLAVPLAGISSDTPEITTPSSSLLSPNISMIPNTASQDPGDFEITGFGSEDIRVTIAVRNAPANTFLTVVSTAELRLVTGYTSYVNVPEVSFIGKLADVNLALASVVVSTGNAATGSFDLEVTAVEEVIPPPSGGDGEIAFNAENGHYYQFIKSDGIAFRTARDQAKTKVFRGLTGYLATITSKSENDFVSKRIQGAKDVWIGATDESMEGVWRWVDGPEAGQVFWRAACTTETVSGDTVQFGSTCSGQYLPTGGTTRIFASWANNEPNNFNGSENYAVTNWSGSEGRWNDLPNSVSSIKGYVVEYSGESAEIPVPVTVKATYVIGVKVTVQDVPPAEPEQEPTVTADVSWKVPTNVVEPAGVDCSSGPVGAHCETIVEAILDGVAVSSCTTNRIEDTTCSIPGLDSNTEYEYKVSFKTATGTDEVTGWTGTTTTVVRCDLEGEVDSSTGCDPAVSDTAVRTVELIEGVTYTVFRDSTTTVITCPEILIEDCPELAGADNVVSVTAFTPGTPNIFSYPLAPTPQDPPEPIAFLTEVVRGSPGGGTQIVPPLPVQPEKENGDKNSPSGGALSTPKLNPPSPLAGPVPITDGVSAGGGATIQGRVVPIDSSSTSDQDLGIAVGDVKLNFNVPGGSGGVNSSSGSPELEVKRDKDVKLAGEGMLPGSTVQVWLPGSSGSKELGRISVDADGTFSGDVSFAASPSGDPLPIGPQVIQLTGVDRNGNQMVINLNINIAQPDPTPELIRGASSPPAPGFGNFLATNAGSDEPAVLTGLPADKSALIEGPGWSMSLALTGDSSSVSNSGGNVQMTIVRGEAAQFGGDGFMPGTIATIWLFSDPMKIGEVTIAADGSFSGQTDAIDAAVEAGEHTIQIQGVGGDGFIRAANLGVLIAEPLVAAAPVPFFDWLPLILLGLLVATGLLAWIIAKRRRRGSEDGSNVIQFPQAA